MSLVGQYHSKLFLWRGMSLPTPHFFHLHHLHTVHPILFHHFPCDQVEPRPWRICRVYLREMDGVDPILMSIQESTKAHHLAFDGAYGFVRNMITHHRNGFPQMV